MSQDIRAHFFPMHLPAQITGQWVSRAEAAVEIQELNAQIFGVHDLGYFQVPPEREENARRLQQNHAPSNPECIVFYIESHQAVGWFYSYCEDATTSFIDTIGFLPDYRGLGLYTTFLHKYLAYAAALGYERVTTTHHPNNRAIIIAELKAGFDIVGLELHESHGPSIKMACFLHPDRRASFERIFSMAPDPTAGIPKSHR